MATFYSLNDIVVLLMFFRLFTVTDILMKNINFSSIKMDEILKSCGLEENFLFVIKCLLKKKPY